ncbi:protein THEMIS [Trichomycterus rosablanca]|uniref:protein THEMIS n=1 Tax=Trichomycterus rosablanca TaxID=2290929 RepID=UPI002F3604B6
MAMTLMEFMQSLDPKALPRILQIQSGIYSQGAVYELFGRECCLVTGDLMKIISISISRFIAHTSEKTEIHLPLDYPGLFRVVADPQPYLSVEEIIKSFKIGSHRLGQPVFISSVSIPLSQGSLKEKEMFCITSVLQDQDGTKGHVECEVLHREPKLSFSLDVSQQGQFIECDDDQFYTLKELAEWKIPKARRRTVTAVKDFPVKDLLYSNLQENVSGELMLTPVYELQAVMAFRKNIVIIPSNLDVEVLDVTDQIDLNSFIQPLSLQDVFQNSPGSFPMVAEVIERPVIERNVSEELASLFSSTHVIIHQAFNAKRILATEIRQESPRHFLIPAGYKGLLKRRPREFPTAYDLKQAQSNTEKLHVVATRAFDCKHDGLTSVLAGDQFVLKKTESSEIGTGTESETDSLTCLKMKGKSHEAVRLPMYLEGGFMEVIHDKRQYSITEVCSWFPLPFNIKVSVRDLSLKVDILAGVPGLRIEEEILEPYLLISTLDLSSWWEISVNRTHMAVHVDKLWTGKMPSCSINAFVEDISEQCYYTMRRYAVATVTPPPRPPKISKRPPGRPPGRPPERPIKTLQMAKPEKITCCSPKSARPATIIRESSTDCTTSLTGSGNTAHIIPATLPRTAPSEVKASAVPRGRSLEDVCLNEPDDDDSHDYEYIDEDELDNIRRQFNQQTINISAKAKPSNTI